LQINVFNIYGLKCSDCSETPKSAQFAFQSCWRSGWSSPRTMSQCHLSRPTSSTEFVYRGVQLPILLRW